ncbi:MAG TPA: farnesyl diphosphate synthase [Pyrinomonadaceae bacterium]|nr:farnesyl diphosphate synthase [Pyrinomonadaceae bacterium]
MSALDSFFSDVTHRVNAELDWLIPEQGQPPQKLRDAIRWSLLSGGKHFRPALVFAVGRAFECCDEKLVRTAAAVEMIHTYSLIHDDLPSMDDDDLRRGRATCHKKYGEATAILAGDALQVLAFKSIADDERLSTDTRLAIVSRLANAAAQMVVGQQLDLDAEGKDLSIEEIEHIHRNKTGALICASAESGAIIGGASEAELAAVRLYGERLGLLFQITDDLLDITQTTEELGKTAGKDAAAAKATYPSVMGIDAAKRFAEQVHDEAVGLGSSLGRQPELLIQVADFILNRRS